MLKKWFIVALLPIFYTITLSAEEKLEDIIIESFTKNDANIYMRIVPNFQEFADVRDSARGAATDLNQTKSLYKREVDDMLGDWREVKEKMERRNIDFSKVKFIDAERKIDKRISTLIGKEAVRYTYLNYMQGDTLFTIKVRECVKFDKGWR
ncbi:MAG: hypothetical protein JXQ76_09155, partial [Campylobacterales bacterium]|nr:hypothetical protein [Campylobacterales bacterium]